MSFARFSRKLSAVNPPCRPGAARPLDRIRRPGSARRFTEEPALRRVEAGRGAAVHLAGEESARIADGRVADRLIDHLLRPAGVLDIVDVDVEDGAVVVAELEELGEARAVALQIEVVGGLEEAVDVAGPGGPRFGARVAGVRDA